MYSISEKYTLGTHKISNATVSKKELCTTSIDNQISVGSISSLVAEKNYTSLLTKKGSTNDIISFLKKKTIIKEVSYLDFMILIISLGNLFFIIKDFQLNFSTLFYGIFLIFSLGLFSISFFTVLKNKRDNNLGEIVDENIISVTDTLKFKSLNKTDEELVLNKENFLFVEAIKNNVHIYYYEDEIIKTRSLRNTLKNIENQIKDEAVFRCHRSFIVNTENIKTAKGNSNNYKIYFNKYNHFIPVSRSYTKSFRELVY